MTRNQTLGRSWVYRSWALVLIVFLVGASGRTAEAASPESEQKARRLFESAEEHFRNGKFSEALVEYQSGYELAPLPGFLINIAQCQRRMGRLAQAKATYRKFIMVAPDSPFVPQVKALIAELDSLTQDLSGPGANAAKPEAVPPQEDTPAPLANPAPRQPNLTPRETAAEDSVVLTTTPAEPTPSPTRWWLWGLIGAAAAGAVTTIVLLSLPPGTKTIHEGSLGTLRQ